jgi:hypothetical protein
MKKQLILIGTLAVLLSGCATTSSSRLTYTPEIRKMSYADNKLFRDMLTGIPGVKFVDEVIFPNAKERQITQIEAIVPYDSHKTGVERWTVQHDGRDTCSYIVRFIPDGRGGTTFAVQAESRGFWDTAIFSKALRDYETAHGGRCADVAFSRLLEPGHKISGSVHFNTIEGVSPTCDRRSYHTRITFDDAARTVAKQVEVLFGPYEEPSYREKAMEFIRLAQAGNLQQMLAITSPLSHATDTDSVRTIYAEQVVPEFEGATVTWKSQSTPTIDEQKNAGLIFTGTAEGKKTFSFDVAVYKEKGKLVIANIRKNQ